jgi:putative transposase
MPDFKNLTFRADQETGRTSVNSLKGWKGFCMKKRHSAEQIVAFLRQADVALGKGQKVPEVCKQLGISEQTYYRWRTKYGGMDPQMARQLQELQKENARLKRLVADQALDNQILREAARPNW